MEPTDGHMWYPYVVSYVCSGVVSIVPVDGACAWCPHSLGSQQHALAAVQSPGVGMLPAQVLSGCLGWELRLTDVAEVSGQVHSLSFGEGSCRYCQVWL